MPAVLGEFTAHGQVGILQNVGGIDAALKPSVHAQADHAPEAVAVALDKDSEAALVAVAGGLQELFVGSGVGAHGGVPIPIHGNEGRRFTARDSLFVAACRAWRNADELDNLMACEPPDMTQLHPFRLDRSARLGTPPSTEQFWRRRGRASARGMLLT
jgi:hypothetical protein